MTTGPEFSEEDIAIAGEYVLGLLPDADRRAFESRLSEEPALRRLVVDWDEEFVALADSVAAETPPDRVRKKVEARLFDEPKRGGRPWFSVLVGAAVGLMLAIIFVAAVPLEPPSPLPQPTHHAEIVAEDNSLHIDAVMNGETGDLELTRLAGTAPVGRSLELWIIAESQPNPISLGVLAEDEPTTHLIVASGHRSLLPGGTLAITDEPPGGSPSGLPTGTVLATGAIAPVPTQG
nr:anti-sigma factor [Pseudoruegeria sp. HB172150]